MELRVFQQKDVSYREMLEFLIKYLVLFDTSSLYSGNQVLAELNDNDLYDKCFNSNKTILIGGDSTSNNGNGNGNGKKQKAPEPNTTQIIESKTREDYGFDLKGEVFVLLKSGAKIIKNALAYVMSFIAFASIYPALPFFVILATLYGIFKWLFSKIRMF